MMQREPNYLYLTIVQVATIFMVTSFAALLGGLALVPLASLSVRRRAIFPGTANRVYVVNLVLWTLFPLYVGLRVFRGILQARRVRSNEIFGAIYVYLLIGVLFAQAN